MLNENQNIITGKKFIAAVEIIFLWEQALNHSKWTSKAHRLPPPSIQWSNRRTASVCHVSLKCDPQIAIMNEITLNLSIWHHSYLCDLFHLGLNAFFSGTLSSSLEIVSPLLLGGRHSSLKSEMIHKVKGLYKLTEHDSAEMVIVSPSKTHYSMMAGSTMRACTAYMHHSRNIYPAGRSAAPDGAVQGQPHLKGSAYIWIFVLENIITVYR